MKDWYWVCSVLCRIKRTGTVAVVDCMVSIGLVLGQGHCRVSVGLVLGH